MSQASLGTLPPSTTSGTQLSTLLVNWQNAVHSGHSSDVGSRPSYVTAGMQWIDKSGPTWYVYRYDGFQDIMEGRIDTENNKAYPGSSVYEGAVPGRIVHPSGLTEQFGRVAIPAGNGHTVTVTFPYGSYSTTGILFTLSYLGGLNPDIFYGVTAYSQTGFTITVAGTIYLPFSIDWHARGI